jgi:cephalosporin hydroxylase
MMKSPLDLFVQQDLIVDLKPELIIETGSFQGGSALFYASLCDLLGHGRVLSIDITPVPHVEHPRVTFLTGDSVAKRTLHEVTRRAHKVKGAVLVILDSCHDASHVRKELEAYHRYVTPGSYLIVEDTNVSGKPVTNPEFAAEGGPYAAIEAWLPDHPEFAADKLCEHYLLTCHPDGWLRRRP